MAFNEFMHGRNIYKERPDFRQIAIDYPELRKYAIPNERGKVYVDLTSPEALRTVTKILLKKDFNLLVEIPTGFLIPTLPQRLNYILWIEDLLNVLPKENNFFSGIDIGTGPCAIFSLLGAQKNGWNFLSTDTSDEALEWAEKNIKANNLQTKVKVLKVSEGSVLDEVLSSNKDNYDFCLCNPPFFDNIEEIRRKHLHKKETLPAITKKNEILSEGGEVAFVRRMIDDSLVYKNRISLYTSMFGKKKSFLQILNELESMNDVIYSKTEFCQGNTVRWGIAWTFLKGIKFIELEKPKPRKILKAKPPLKLHVPFTKETASCALKNLSQKVQDILSEFEIQFEFSKCFANYIEMQISSNKNTWSHQRKKRRKQMRDEIKNFGSDSVAGDPLKSSSLNVALEKVKTSALNLAASATDEVDSTSPTNCGKTNVDSHMPTTTECPSSDFEVSATKDSISKNKAVGSQAEGCTSNKNPVKRNLEDSMESSKKAKLDLNTPSKSTLESNVTTECQRSDREISSSKDSNGQSKVVESRGDDCSINKNSLKRKIEDSMEPCKKARLDFNTSSNSSKCDSKNNTENDSFQCDLILNSCLKLIKCKSHLLVEMNCPPSDKRETMHQVLQLLKNKLI